MSTPTTQTVSVDGVSVAYEVLNANAPKTLLMVHGFRGNRGGLLRIAKLIPDYRIIIPDLPGHGTTPAMQPTHDVAGYAAWVRRFISALELDHFIVLGHSFGALVASRLVADSPKGIERLILVNPVSESNKRLASIGLAFYAVGFALPEAFGQALLNSKAGSYVMSYLMMRTKQASLRSEIYAHHLHDLDHPLSRRVLKEAVASATKGEVLSYASAITLPTLIIAGELDELAPLPKQHQLQNLIHGSQLEIIPGVGHLTHLETPDQVAQLILSYLTTPLSDVTSGRGTVGTA
jgi:pimeloyl-ACP methyl ester carboxylesterase